MRQYDILFNAFGIFVTSTAISFRSFSKQSRSAASPVRFQTPTSSFQSSAPQQFAEIRFVFQNVVRKTFVFTIIFNNLQYYAYHSRFYWIRSHPTKSVKHQQSAMICVLYNIPAFPKPYECISAAPLVSINKRWSAISHKGAQPFPLQFLTTVFPPNLHNISSYVRLLRRSPLACHRSL